MVIGCLLTINLLYLPSIKGFHSSNKLKEQIEALNKYQSEIENTEKKYTSLRKEWEDKLLFSEDALLEFILSLTDEIPIRLIDFNLEKKLLSPNSNQSTNDRYRFEIRGSLYPTLSFLNAVEERFPFAILEQMEMKKKIERKKTYLHTTFSIQQ